jgi:two-component system sensor histidine kinase RegB
MASASSFAPAVNQDPPPSGEGADTPALATTQGHAAGGRSIRIRLLVYMRAGLLAGQAAVLLALWLGVKYSVPWAGCLTLIGISAIINLMVALSPAMRREATDWEAFVSLAFDTLQMTAVLLMTGGVINAFGLVFIIPVTIAGGVLPPRLSGAICVMAMTCTVFLAILARHGPLASAETGALFAAYRLFGVVAILVCMVFSASYASWSSGHRTRNELALRITETVLSREQRLSALGALAAAAAHELGTPLATISVVAKEMANEAGEGPFKDDAWLLVEQAQRCRDILKRLAERPDQSDQIHERVSLTDLVREVVSPYLGAQDLRVDCVVIGPPSLAPPDLWRRQEVHHALAALVDNAFDFARSEILVTGRYGPDFVSIEVKDDGPGFAPKVLAKLGEPYLTSRPGAEGSRSGHIGMGLGFFIAKTLLERTGAQVDFRNGPALGAIVTAKWPRSRIEAVEGAA